MTNEIMNGTQTNSPYEETSDYNPTATEQSMWRAVVVQALMDASSMSKKAEMQQYKREALVWLRGNSEDFFTVCYYAGLDPECTREMIKDALARGCNWRAAPGTGDRAKKYGRSGRKPTNSR